MTAAASGPPPALAALAAASPSLAELVEGAARAARTEATVLVLGEPGTGRSTLARALHAAGPRAAGPLQEIDAGALPTTLFESELFGHVAGAFTGAASPAAGRVAGADGGTLVLDRVEEIPLASQPKLLRLLSERAYAPLGGAERHADVRFVAVGAHDLPRRVERGAFRADLYYRLEVVTLELPPLRDRRADVAALAEFFVADLAERFGLPEPALADSARAWMERYPWPGNLRELRNLLERALVLDPGGPLVPRPPAGAPGGPPRSLQEVEREQILAALAWTRGHQGRAAEILGISRKALWQKRKRLGIP